MTSVTTVRLRESGVRELERALREGVRTVLDATASDARDLAPVETGELRGSIDVVMGEAPEGLVVALAEHALEVEIGTIDTRAQPYLTPALLRRREDAPRLMAAGVARRGG